MAKTLLIFIQSKNVDVYVNALTHCVQELGVCDIYFVGEQATAGKEYVLLESIGQIRSRVEGLSADHEVYHSVCDLLPTPSQTTSRIIRLIFVSPEQAIPQIKKRFPEIPTYAISLAGSPLPFFFMGKRPIRALLKVIKGTRGQSTYQLGETRSGGARILWLLARPFALLWRHASILGRWIRFALQK